MTRSELRRKHFHRFFIICLVLAVLYVWADIWTDLRVYENADDDDVMAAFCSRLAEEARRGSCARLLSDSGFETNYLTLDHEGQTLASVVRGKELSYERNAEDDSLYDIYADGELLAVVSLDISDYYGLLRLPSYSVVSIRGTKSADYVVKSPRNIYIGDTARGSLKPVQTSLTMPEMEMLAAGTLNVAVPEYLVYRAEKLFSVPSLSSRGTPQFYYPMKETGEGVYLVGDYPEFELTDELGARITAFAEALSRYKCGDSDWESVKDYVCAEEPVSTALEALGVGLPAPPTEFDMGEVEMSEVYGWTPTLASVRCSYCFTVKNGEEEIRTDEDLTLYITQDEDDPLWHVCFIDDHLAPEEPAPAPVTEETKENEKNTL